METNVLELLTVLLKDSCSALDLMVIDVSVQWEAMVHIVVSHEARNTTETVDWERLVAVVAFKNGAY